MNYIKSEGLKKRYIHHDEIIKELYKVDNKDFKDFVGSILESTEFMQIGLVLLDVEDNLFRSLIDILPSITVAEVVESLESDEATDLIIKIEKHCYDKYIDVIGKISQKNRDTILALKKYEDNVAGALMKTEFFSVSLYENIHNSLDRLKLLKSNKNLLNIHQIYIIDHSSKLISIISLGSLILEDFSQQYKDILDRTVTVPVTIKDTENVDKVIKTFDKFGFTVIPVVSDNGVLLGIITSDDIYDAVNKSATEQIYNLVGAGENKKESFFNVLKSRSFWLVINLLTTIVTTFVLKFYEVTINEYIAIAILLPIVASMGGNAVMQTLAVTVRNLTLKEISKEIAKSIIYREVLLGFCNGILFGVLGSLVSYLFYDNFYLGITMFLSMFINMFLAGFFGVIIPIVLKKIRLDPAIGSTVILTTITDVAGYISFIVLFKYIIEYSM